jgi:peptide deformylase
MMTQELPDYVTLESPNAKVLTQPAASYTFPLSSADLEEINTLREKYESEENCAGLAAPQIGISKQAIVFKVENDQDVARWRPDLKQTMPQTLWLNPSYEPLKKEGQADFETHIDYEACFSVKGVAGPVKRYTKIAYKAYDIQGKLIEGIATGFLARVIQHETDHIRGKLYIEYVAPEDLLPVEEYRRMREAALAKKDAL